MTTYCCCQICKNSLMKVNGNENGQAEIASPERYQLPDGYQLVHFSNRAWPSLMSRELVEFDVSVAQPAASAALSMGGQSSASAASAPVMGVSASAPPIGSHAGAAPMSGGDPAAPAPRPAVARRRYCVGLFCFAFPIDYDFKGQVQKELSQLMEIDRYPYIYLISRQVLAGAPDVTMHACRTSRLTKGGHHPQIALAIGCGGSVVVAASASLRSISSARGLQGVSSAPGSRPGAGLAFLHQKHAHPALPPAASSSAASKPSASSLSGIASSFSTASSSSAGSTGLYSPSLLNVPAPNPRAKPGYEAVRIMAGQFGSEVQSDAARINQPA